MKQSRLDFLNTYTLKPVPFRSGECVRIRFSSKVGVVKRMRTAPTMVRDPYGVYLVEIKSDGGSVSQQFWHESEMEAV